MGLGVSLRQVGQLLEAGDPKQLLQAQLAVTERELQRLGDLRDKLVRSSSCALGLRKRVYAWGEFV